LEFEEAEEGIATFMPRYRRIFLSYLGDESAKGVDDAHLDVDAFESDCQRAAIARTPFLPAGACLIGSRASFPPSKCRVTLQPGQPKWPWRGGNPSGKGIRERERGEETPSFRDVRRVRTEEQKESTVEREKGKRLASSRGVRAISHPIMSGQISLTLLASFSFS